MSAEVYVPSIDVCAICQDSECDGISCVSDLDPDDSGDQPRLERLQELVRWGRAWEAVQELLADAENREWPVRYAHQAVSSDVPAYRATPEEIERAREMLLAKIERGLGQ